MCDDEVDDSLCVIDKDDVDLFLGKVKLSKKDREDLEVEGVGEFDIS